MEKQNGILGRITLPTRIIVQRMRLSAEDLAGSAREDALRPAGAETCELEAGGQVIAQGKIVRKRGEFFFKVLRTAKEEQS